MPARKTQLRYALYVRVSSDRQDVENSTSAQIAAATRWVETNGGKIVITYQDDAKSGKVEQRPAFQQMIRDATDENPPFDAILVWKHSRFARNRKISITYKSLLAEHGIRVISISENTGEGPAAQMVEGIIESVDEFHSANMGVDIKQGMRNSVERGFYLARSAPTGYKIIHVKDGGKYRPKLELDPPWNQIPRRVFDLALLDLGLKAIANQLNEEGTRTRNGKLFNPVKVSRILKNPHYTGYTFWDYRNKNDNFAKSLEPAHPAIVSPEEYEAVQRKTASRHRDVVHPRTVAAEYLFNDLGFCTQCGHKIIIKGGNSGKYRYFVCSKRFKYGKRACDMPRYPLVKNDPIIMNAIIHDILNQRTLKTLLRQVHSISAPSCHTTEQKLADLDTRTDDLDSRESQLLIALEMQTFSFAKIQERMAIIQDQRNKIEEERQAIIAETDTEEAFLNEPNLILAYAKDLTTYLRKATVRSANASLKRFIKSLAFEKGFVTINYMIPLPDSTPVGTDYRRLALDGPVRPTISVGPPSLLNSPYGVAQISTSSRSSTARKRAVKAFLGRNPTTSRRSRST